ncbi:MAG TPA: hypothetical protein IAA98_10360 [Candidatus Avipropionibacterium avicola]|uniref:Uncharacterized protein n=1 Tax=Candidatus Avipropionibacterium avicola TaxID=2840701 RepID=A0A9D1KP45_9ACTN|nr:hypothetical protein [Candidatus Avipropionibacterium avicola]
MAEAEHVTSSDLSTSGGGTMRTQLNGDIHFDVAEDQPLTALDQVWRTVVEYVFDLDDGHGGRTVLVPHTGPMAPRWSHDSCWVPRSPTTTAPSPSSFSLSTTVSSDPHPT